MARVQNFLKSHLESCSSDSTPAKIYESFLIQGQPPSRGLAGATGESPCSATRASAPGKARENKEQHYHKVKNSSVGEGYLVLVLVIFTICRTDGASL